MLTINKDQQYHAWQLVLLLVVMFFSFYFALGSYTLFNNNEGLYASIAKHMLLTKSFIIPYLNCVPYIEKPPLLYWLLALSFSVFGYTEFAARLVTASSAALLCYAILYFTNKIKITKIGFIATLIFASSAGISIIARMVYFDMLLTFLISCTLFCLFYWYESQKVVALRGSYLFLGLAILAKGLVAIILVGGSFGLFLLLEKKFWKQLYQAIDWLGIALFLAIVLPWHIAATLQHQGFFYNYVIGEHFLRFLNLREPHDYYHGPIYYYLPRITIYIFPWSCFLPLIFLRIKDLSSLEYKLLRFCWCWLLVPLIFFSLSSAKANYYMVVSMPALAIILSMHLHALFTSKHAKLFNVSVALILIAITTGIAFYFVTMSFPFPAILICKKLIFITIAYSLVAGIMALIFIKRQQLAVAILAGLIIPIAIMATAIIKLANDDLSAAKTGIFLAKNKNLTPVYLYQDFENFSAISFYANTCFKIVDSQSKDLHYGANLPQFKQWFITNKELLQETLNHPFYLVVPTKKLEQFYKNITGVKITILQKYQDLVIVRGR